MAQFFTFGGTNSHIPVEKGIDIANHPVETNTRVHYIIKEQDGVIDLSPSHNVDAGKENRITHSTLNDATIINH